MIFKKVFKILLTILAVIIVLVVAVAIFQWENISAVISGIKDTPEQIIQKREDNNKELVEKVNEYIDGELREPTEEEMALVASGKMSLDELYSKIFSENSSTLVEYDTEKDEFVEKAESANESIADNKASSEKNEKKESAKTKSAEDIVSKYISQLYALQSAYTAKAAALISGGAKHYNELVRKGQEKATARAATISNFTGPVRGAIADCDAKVEDIVKKMESELKAINADTSIIETVRKTYASEKRLKLSYYSNKYLK